MNIASVRPTNGSFTHVSESDQEFYLQYRAKMLKQLFTTSVGESYDLISAANIMLSFQKDMTDPIKIRENSALTRILLEEVFKLDAKHR